MASSVTRPEAMNATTHHPKVKVSIKLSDPFFVAGGTVSGKMELECKADSGLGVGVIKVELFAIEELTSRDHSATSTFIHATRLFQGQGLPPSNAVLAHPIPGEPPLPPHHWQARRGQTAYLFRFPLPTRTPASIDFGRGLARVRYEVRASAGAYWKGERRLVTHVCDAPVVEDAADADATAEAVVVGENGKIWAQGRVIGGVLVAGHSACLELQVKNHSAKKNTGLAVSLSRYLHLPNAPPGDKPPLQISDTLTSVDFKGPEYVIGPGVEGVANLVFDVPKHAAGVRGGQREGEDGEGRISSPLFEVRCVVSCKIGMSIGSKDILVEIPVRIVHPAVLPPPPIPEDYPPMDAYAAAPQVPYPGYNPSLAPAPSVYDMRPTSPYSHDGRPLSPYMAPRPTSPYAYPALPVSPSMSPRPTSPYAYHPGAPVSPAPPMPYVDASRVWLPPPTQALPYPHFPPVPVPSPHNYYLPQGYAPHSRPASVGPAAHPRTHLHPRASLPAGLPANAEGQAPLLAALAAVPERQEEEARGARATRVSHHLRMSSRGRSVSPPPSKRELADTAPPLAHAVSSGAGELASMADADASAAALSLPAEQRRPNMRMSFDGIGAGSTSPLHSPRPMLSPKASFSNERPMDGSLARSDRVAALEALAQDMASLELRDDADGQAAQGINLSKDKTLPGPPVPSGKPTTVAAPRPRVDTIFETGLAPPTPTLGPRRPARGAQASGNDGPDESGLDALERKLLAGVGTLNGPPTAPMAIPRKAPDTPLNESAISSLTLSNRSLGGGGTPGAHASMGMGMGVGMDLGIGLGLALDADPDAPAQPRTPRGEPLDLEKQLGEPRTPSGRKERSAPAVAVDSTQLRKAAKGRVAAWLENISPDVPPQIDSIAPSPEPILPPPFEYRLKDDDEESEGGKTNKTSKARSRPPSPDSDVPPLPSRQASMSDIGNASEKGKKPTEDAPVAAAATADEAKATLNTAPNPRSSGFVPIGTQNTKFTTPGTIKASRLPAFPPMPSNGLAPPGEVKYDIRSARGGRGGKVTSVAALWSAQSKDADPAGTPSGKAGVFKSTSAPAMKSSTSQKTSASSTQKPGTTPAKVAPPKPSSTTKPTSTATARPSPAATPKPTSPAARSTGTPSAKTLSKPTTSSPAISKSPPPARSFSPTRAPIPKLARPTPFASPSAPMVTKPMPNGTSTGELGLNRAKVVKSSTLPAVVSSSLAMPTLSSTASLARPSTGRTMSGKVLVPPTISEGLAKVQARVVSGGSDAKSNAPKGVAETAAPQTDTAFGQARLRELIKKYQGQPQKS